MFEVYRYPKDLETEEIKEEVEYIGDYTNYQEDEFGDLPVLEDKYPEIAKEFTDSGLLTAVIYVCETMDDVKKAYPRYNTGGGFWDGEFSYVKGDYYYIFPEYGMTCMIVPKELEEEVKEFISSSEE